MRADLPWPTIAVSVAHAAGESSPGHLPPDAHAVILSVPNEAKLLALARRIEEAEISYVLVREPDDPWQNAAMSIGINPLPKIQLKKLLSHLPLLK